ncbi:MAG: UDP-N-acetylmuramoyl-tripeptide--D-alanyl-D-alanine ligase [Herpetosiphonaceae bacterium]|nr:UDP-N-acetylmuramoyl-tripeptide--D-alanyl-D-alanine ligase [Herpetosiphonaceae bacterium]
MITLEDLVGSATGSDAFELGSGQGRPFAHAVIDSRLADFNDLFVALPGEQVDGHRFVGDALQRGARAALVREAWLAQQDAAWDLPVIRNATDLAGIDPDQTVLVAVADPLTTLQGVAATYRRRFALDVVGITGSVGKTSTKEALAAVLRQRLSTLYSVKSYNNEIGVPLTLLRLTPEHQIAVLEMGTYGPGDIALLCEWAQPRYGIVTNVGVSHLERMKTPDVVAHAKSELPRALPADGIAVLNYDDERARNMAGLTAARPLFYGLTPQADVWADDISSHGLQGISFTVHSCNTAHRFTIPLVGRHSVQTALPVVALARELGFPWEAIEAGLCDPLLQQRIRVLPGPNGATIIDDTYNAAPVSCKAALNLLHDLPGRHLAVFAEMAELGPVEEAGHREVGEAAAMVVDQLVVVGPKARSIGQAARALRPDLPVAFAATNTEAVEVLRPMLVAGDVLLVKGARVAATEQIVRDLVGEE